MTAIYHKCMTGPLVCVYLPAGVGLCVSVCAVRLRLCQADSLWPHPEHSDLHSLRQCTRISCLYGAVLQCARRTTDTVMALSLARHGTQALGRPRLSLALRQQCTTAAHGATVAACARTEAPQNDHTTLSLTNAAGVTEECRFRKSCTTIQRRWAVHGTRRVVFSKGVNSNESPNEDDWHCMLVPLRFVYGPVCISLCLRYVLHIHIHTTITSSLIAKQIGSGCGTMRLNREPPTDRSCTRPRRLALSASHHRMCRYQPMGLHSMWCGQTV